MKKEIMRRNYEKTKLFNKNGVFSLEYDKETLRDMVQKELLDILKEVSE